MACFQTRKDFDMSNRLPLGMAEATRLIQAGNLMGATALIQRLLQGGDAAEPADTGSSLIIDMEPVTVDAAPPRPQHSPPLLSRLPPSRLLLAGERISPASSTPSPGPG